jgi:hypothetical protein
MEAPNAILDIPADCYPHRSDWHNFDEGLTGDDEAHPIDSDVRIVWHQLRLYGTGAEKARGEHCVCDLVRIGYRPDATFGIGAFRESFTFPKLAGIVLIIDGVLLLNQKGAG